MFYFVGDTRYQTCNWPDQSFFRTCSGGCEVVSNTGSYGTHPRCKCERGFKRAPNGKDCISKWLQRIMSCLLPFCPILPCLVSYCLVLSCFVSFPFVFGQITVFTHLREKWVGSMNHAGKWALGIGIFSKLWSGFCQALGMTNIVTCLYENMLIWDMFPKY